MGIWVYRFSIDIYVLRTIVYIEFAHAYYGDYMKFSQTKFVFNSFFM